MKIPLRHQTSVTIMLLHGFPRKTQSHQSKDLFFGTEISSLTAGEIVISLPFRRTPGSLIGHLVPKWYGIQLTIKQEKCSPCKT